MALTDTAIRNAKPSDKPTKLTDSGELYLLFNPNGSRWWRLDYRYGDKHTTELNLLRQIFNLIMGGG